MITSRSKWRPANRSFIPLNLLIVGPFLPNHYRNPLDLAICTRAKRILFCVLTLLSILGTQLLAQNITGSWQATLGDPPNGLRAILKISKSGSDLSAQLFSIDQGPEGIPVSTISLEGSDLKF